ncbi:hypothetical protein ANN_17457 [Periplaneta americana]|uniref:Per a allergen n=1 Tax=Periplaneta americana TaxID=6978 RepID=A0ABQ8ST03_PERAM|nr:hypothetical protein ANN_17457 [Periplaneta americana]
MACAYHSENFKVVKDEIDSFDSSDAGCIRVAQESFFDPEIEGKLCFVSQIRLLPSAITSLDESGGKLVDGTAVKKIVAANVLF